MHKNTKILLSILLLNFNPIFSLGYFGYDYDSVSDTSASDFQSHRYRSRRARGRINEIEFPIIVETEEGEFMVDSEYDLRMLAEGLHKSRELSDLKTRSLETLSDEDSEDNSDDLAGAREDLSSQMKNLNAKNDYYKNKNDLIKKQSSILDASMNPRPEPTVTEKLKKTTADKLINTVSNMAVVAATVAVTSILDPIKNRLNRWREKKD